MGRCEFPGDLTAEHASGDYRNFYDLSVGDTPYVVAIHNEECGASILPRASGYDSDLEPFTNFLETAENHLRGDIEDAAGTMMVAFQPLIGDPQARGLIGGINLFDPSYNDVEDIREGLNNVEAYLADIVDNPMNSWLKMKAEELGVSQDDLRGDLQLALDNIDEAKTGLQTVIETDPYYAALSGAEQSMREQGFAEPDIISAFTVPENVNADQTVAPSAPGMEQFP